MTHLHHHLYIIFIAVFSILLFIDTGGISHALLNETDLRQQIDAQQRRIREINKEIEQYNEEIIRLGEESRTLNVTLKEYSVAQNQTRASIRKLQSEIRESNLEIQRLSLIIQDTSQTIGETKETIGALYRITNEQEMRLDFEPLLLAGDISLLDTYEVLYDTQQLSDTLQQRATLLSVKRSSLEETQNLKQKQQRQLKSSEDDLIDKNIILSSNISEQRKIIDETKNEEQRYAELKKTREEDRKKIELSVLEYESRLQFILDPDSIPDNGAILSWPLKSVRITQGFGCTPFARRNPGIYGGICFHPGIDLAASPGTKIYAPLEGIVLATGDTDRKRGCYSFGKWMAIEHPNGLTSIYAHLNIIKVKAGDTVRRGEHVGYTGNTGISTGPHLDFRIYASNGVEVVKFERINPATSCKGVSIPTAHKDAKLNPFNYLPDA